MDMNVTYGELRMMLSVINKMLQVKPGAIVDVIAPLGMNANRIENALKGYAIAQEAILAEYKAKTPCVLARIVDSNRRSRIIDFLAKAREDVDAWEEIAAASEVQAMAPRWFQRAELTLEAADLAEMWEAEAGMILGPFGIDFMQYYGIHVLKHEDQDVVPTDKQEEYSKKSEELNEQSVSIKLAKIKVSDLKRSVEARPGYVVDGAWFYAAPKMFVPLAEETEEDKNDI